MQKNVSSNIICNNPNLETNISIESRIYKLVVIYSLNRILYNNDNEETAVM